MNRFTSDDPTFEDVYRWLSSEWADAFKQDVPDAISVERWVNATLGKAVSLESLDEVRAVIAHRRYLTFAEVGRLVVAECVAALNEMPITTVKYLPRSPHDGNGRAPVKA